MVIQLLANGVVAGCVYGLIALGFGLIYSTTKKKEKKGSNPLLALS